MGDTLDVQEINVEAKNALYNEVLNSGKPILWQGIEDNINLKSKNKKVIVIGKILKSLDLNTYTEKPIGLLIINYDLDVFYNQFSDANQDTEFMILDRNNRIVYHPDQSRIGSIPDGELLKKINSNSGSLKADVEGESKLGLLG